MISAWKSTAVAAAASWGAIASTGAQSSPAATLNRAAAVYAHVTTARGTFEQTLTNPLTGTSAVARGDFQQERPSRLAVHFTDPSGDRIVADGQWVWVYVPSATPGQVMRMPVGDGRTASTGGAMSLDFIGQILTNPAARFAITGAASDTIEGHRMSTVVLVPHDAGDQIARAKLWIDDVDGLVRQFEETDAGGTVRRVRLVTEFLNVPVDRSAFKFTPPPGVKVVDQAAMVNGTE
jgi:outer membrane lipoprotein carrier protein